jgi:hypothetical protein
VNASIAAECEEPAEGAASRPSFLVAPCPDGNPPTPEGER